MSLMVPASTTTCRAEALWKKSPSWWGGAVVDAEIVERVLVCIAIAERDQTVEAGHGPRGMATAGQLPGDDGRGVHIPKEEEE
jgi:hypothetical protein